jgi:methylglutaconyl-CoA hydratase
MPSETLRVSRSTTGIVTFVLARPETSNALDGDLLARMTVALAELKGDASARVLVLRGEGKHFCAGADVKSGGSGSPLDGARATIDGVCERLNEFPRPTVCVVHGACIGAGIALAAACDTVIAARDAVFSIPEVRLGFAPAVLMPIFLKACGLRFLRRYALSGERFDSEAAKQVGLVHELCSFQEIDQRLSAIVDALLRAAPDATVNAKALLLKAASSDIDSDELRRLHERWITSDEAKEGLASFKQKRHPNWYASASS